MTIRNVLVFPAGTEIGLALYQSMKYCKEVRLFGAGQDISNHARFAYPNYHHLPSIYEEGWLECLIELCHSLSIDYIFPAYDDIIVALIRHKTSIPATIISSSEKTCEITRSKSKTYRCLRGHIRVPDMFDSPDKVKNYPVLVKPDMGQGSFGVSKINNRQDLVTALSSLSNSIICEYLPGEEYTVDCFSDRKLGVMFAQARSRRRTLNGISVNTITEDLSEVMTLAEIINEKLHLRGAWFFQLKRADDGGLALLEVAPRIAGTMATNRVTGVNFPLLSIFEHERLPITIMTNPGQVELDRALCNRYRHNVHFDTLYIDLDDTLLIGDQINVDLIRLIFDCINRGKLVKLITRHKKDLLSTLTKHRLYQLFDEVIHLKNGECKSSCITEKNAIFIDDSFAERQEVSSNLGILTFDCSMAEMLIDQAESL